MRDTLFKPCVGEGDSGPNSAKQLYPVVQETDLNRRQESFRHVRDRSTDPEIIINQYPEQPKSFVGHLAQMARGKYSSGGDLGVGSPSLNTGPITYQAPMSYHMPSLNAPGKLNNRLLDRFSPGFQEAPTSSSSSGVSSDGVPSLPPWIAEPDRQVPSSKPAAVTTGVLPSVIRTNVGTFPLKSSRATSPPGRNVERSPSPENVADMLLRELLTWRENHALDSARRSALSAQRTLESYSRSVAMASGGSIAPAGLGPSPGIVRSRSADDSSDGMSSGSHFNRTGSLDAAENTIDHTRSADTGRLKLFIA